MTSLTTAFAADKAATAKVTVDKQPAAVQGYEIDGSNYYELRDLAEILDFGLSWDAASSTISIDSTSSYKSDATKLIQGNWAPATRARIQAVIDANANKGKYVVFDFDTTSVVFDIQEALLVYQIENLEFKMTPEQLPDVLATGIPDLKKELGKSLDGKTVTPETLIADITSDYTWLYEIIRASRAHRSCLTSMRPISIRILRQSCATCTARSVTTLTMQYPIRGLPTCSPV